MPQTETLAILTFNTAAVHEMFAADQAKGLRIRIVRGVVGFRSVKPGRGIDIVSIERRPRSVVVDLEPEPTQKRLLQCLFKAGLSEEQPYFLLEPIERGWFGVQHHPYDHPPQRQPVLVVSGFEPPPLPIEMAVWRRCYRLMSNERPIDDALWQSLYRMIQGAISLAAMPKRNRPTVASLAAHKLVAIVQRHLPLFVDAAARQPSLARDVAALCEQLPRNADTAYETVTDLVPEAEVQPITREHPVITRDYVRQVLSEQLPPAPPMPRMRRSFPIKPVVQPPKPITEPAKPNRVTARPVRTTRRRPWPMIAPVDLGPEPDELPAAVTTESSQPISSHDATGREPEHPMSSESVRKSSAGAAIGVLSQSK